MESSPPTIRLAFDQATAFFITATESVRPEQWDNPGLGEWSVRDLVGHTSRALLTVETYLGRPAPTVELTTPADYFLAVAASLTDPAQVAQRGRNAGAALGQDPIKAVGEIATRVRALVATADDAQTLSTPIGGMRLADYLPTRIFELVVHTLDLATAIGAPVELPTEAARVSFQLAGDLALRTGKGATVLRALTGRGPLPGGFSIL